MASNKPLHGAIDDLPDAPGLFFEGSQKKVVFGPTRFWPDYVMRCWIVQPGCGERQTHHHPWPHIVVCIEGETSNILGDEHFDMKPGDWEYIPGDIEHCFWNKSDTEICKILCIVPPKGDIAIKKGC